MVVDELPPEEDLPIHPYFKDIKGNKYGMLTVLRFVGRFHNTDTVSRHSYWGCVCDCGNLAVVAGNQLRNKGTISCGCLTGRITRKKYRRIKEQHDFKHERFHGMSMTPEQFAWQNIIKRCHKEYHGKYKLYGERGIKVCDRWRESFNNFYEDMGPKPSPEHSIDRIDNDGDYEPGNCRWATRQEQQNNRRNNHRITFNGETLTLTQWGRRVGINPATISSRIVDRGWSVERALTELCKRGQVGGDTHT